MPHKNNPRKPEALIQHSRSIPRLAEVILDDVQNYFERDNTSRPNRVLAEISMETEAMYKVAIALVRELKVNDEVMVENVNRTRGLILAQRLTFTLAKHLGKAEANRQLQVISRAAYEQDLTLRAAFRASDLSELIDDDTLNEILEPATYIGLAVEQTEAIIDQIRQQREQEGL